MLKEFKDFVAKGNVIDLAVGIIIGGAFALIVGSLVDDIIMPIVGIFMGGIDFSSLSATVGGAVVAYGKFIMAIVNFIIIAFVIFLLVRWVNNLKKAEEEAPAPAGPSEVDLLTEIRDALKK